MNPPYEDAPLMIATGVIGLWFGVLGIRAMLAQRRERKPIPPPAPVEQEHESWDAAVVVRRTKR